MDCKRRRQGIEDYTGTHRNRDDAGAANAREKNFTAAVLYAAVLAAVPILFSLAWLMIVGFRFATSCREGYQFQIPVVEYVWYIQYTVFPLWRERPDGTGRRRPDGAGDDHCPATATSTGCGLSPRITRGSGRIYPYPLHSAFQAGKPDTRHSVARSSALRRVPGSCFSSRIEQRYTFTKRGVPLCAPLSTSYVCGGPPEGPAS
ncbi:MAG TPA: hypothetical protein PLG75_09300 [Methanoculleus sp.]|nr:hypothetical protein [Methanoculleus sp.]